MKYLWSFLSVPVLAQNYRQNAIYLEKNFQYGSTLNDITQALKAGYNRFYTGFYMSRYGAQGGALEWQFNLNDAERTQVKQTLAAYNATLWLSVGGPGEFWEEIIDQNYTTAVNFAQSASNFAKQYQYDGIEIAIKLSGEATIPSPIYYDSGLFSQCAQDMATTFNKNGWNRSQLAVSSNAPYFSPIYASGNITNCLSWLGLQSNKNETWSVSDLNLMMFNEDGNYMTYDNIFVKNTYADPYAGTYGAGSAVNEIMDLGVGNKHVAVIKPISQAELSVRSGWISGQTLGEWGCTANDSFGWLGGFIGWTWNGNSLSEKNKVYTWANQTSLGNCYYNNNIRRFLSDIF